MATAAARMVSAQPRAADDDPCRAEIILQYGVIKVFE
jgi:hypothetical protein